MVKLQWAQKIVESMTFEEQSLRTVIMVCSKEGALVPVCVPPNLFR